MKKRCRTILTMLCIAVCLIFAYTIIKHDFIAVSAPVIEEASASTPTPEPTMKPPETVKFIGVGDNLIHDCLYLQAAKRSDNGTYDFSYPYAHTKSYVSDFDIQFINQETLVNDAFAPSTYPTFSSPVELGYEVLDLGFNAIGMSNNHSYDKGADGVLSTLDFWNKQNGIEYFGFYTGNDAEEIKYMDVNGVKVAFLAYTSWTNGLSLYDPDCPKVVMTDDDATIERQVKTAKENADIVIVSCHWGNEGTNQTIPAQHEIAKKLNALGVDAIIGTHPHVIQTVEWIEHPQSGQKTIVCYSLGNFISAQASANTMLGGMFQFDLVKTYTDVEGHYVVTIEHPKFVPVVTHYEANFANIRNYLLKDYTPELAQVHGVKAKQNVFSIEYMEAILEQYIPEEFLLYP